MKDYKSPIVVIAFNRPKNLELVLFSISVAIEGRPVYIFVDHPRQGRTGDVAPCAAVSRIVGDFARNKPSVNIIKRSENLGCRRNIEQALDYVFGNYDRAIILEDDCLPSDDFLPFCEIMLNRFENDPTVGLITGGNFLNISQECGDYYRTRYPLIWGWATWARVWNSHDKQMADYGFRILFLKMLERMGVQEILYWRHYFCEVKGGRIDTWDYQLTWTCFKDRLDTICPTFNSIQNIGFGPDATHTYYDDSDRSLPHADCRKIEVGAAREYRAPEINSVIFRRRFGGFSFWDLFKLEVKRLIRK
jgi:hypothetical protein